MNVEKRKHARATGVVSLAILCSRVLGLVREMVFAALFGGGRSMDMFYAAFRTPNMMRDLFAEGALSTAFVTTFSKKLVSEDRKAAWALASKIMTLLAVFMSGVVLLGILLAPWIVRLMNPGFDLEKVRTTVFLVQVMFPFIGIVSLAALAMGILNARHVFGIPALASSFFNLGSIIAGTALGWYIDPSFGPDALLGLALGTLIGGLAQLAVQIPSLCKVGFRPVLDFRWRDPGVVQVLKLMGPAVLAGSLVQVNVVINQFFASFLGDGPIGWLQWAFRLMQLPLGVFGVAVSMVVLPALSRSIARSQPEEFSQTLSHGLRLVSLFTLPSAIGLTILAQPIIALIFQRGAFNAHDTVQTAAALQFYSIGLIFYASLKVVQPAFYALDRRYVPMIVTLCTLGLSIALNALFVFVWDWGHRGLALATSLTTVVNFSILFVLMQRHVDAQENRKLLFHYGKLAVASLWIVGICVFAQMYWLDEFLSLPLGGRIIRLGATIALSAATFLATCYVFRVDELREMVSFVHRKSP